MVTGGKHRESLSVEEGRHDPKRDLLNPSSLGEDPGQNTIDSQVNRIEKGNSRTQKYGRGVVTRIEGVRREQKQSLIMKAPVVESSQQYIDRESKKRNCPWEEANTVTWDRGEKRTFMPP